MSMFKRILAISWARYRSGINRLRSVEGALNAFGNILMGIMSLVLSLIIGIGFGVLAYFAADEAESSFFQITFVTLFSFCLISGILVPLLMAAFGRTFQLSRLLAFPVSRSELFVIALGSSFLSVQHLFYYPALFFASLFGVLLVVSFPLVGIAIVVSMWLLTVVWGFTINSYLESLLRHRRAKEIFGVTVFGVLFLLSMMLMVVTDDSPEQLASHSAMERVNTVAQWMAPAVRHLPPVVATEALQHLRDGKLQEGLFLLGELLAWVFVGLGLSFAIFVNYLLGDRGGESKAIFRKAGRRPTATVAAGWEITDLPFFSRQTLAMAEKEFCYLMRSSLGKFNLVATPALVLVLIFVFGRGSFEMFPRPEGESLGLYGLVSYMAMIMSNTANNTLAWDSEGVSTYFFCPLDLQRVLLGKNLAQWVYNGACFIIAMVTWAIVKEPPGLATWLKVTLLYASLLLAFSAVGNVLSVVYPVRRDVSSMKNSPSGIAAILNILTMLVATLVVCLFVALPAFLGYASLIPWCLTLLLAGLVVPYRKGLAIAAKKMADGREKILLALRA